MRKMLAILILMGPAAPGFATDGVLEINQTCAVQAGCFAGDTAGFPVTINGAAGHGYRLTSDLTVPNENTDGIVVSTNDVGIDLNSFAILGPVVCSGSPLTCTPSSGFGTGIQVTSISTPIRGLSIRNGSITGMGEGGISAGQQATITNLRVCRNRGEGIFVNGGSTISGNIVGENLNRGIVASSSTISGNTIYLNGRIGINAGAGSNISGNTVFGNEEDGIFVGTGGAIVSDNAVHSNGGDGIQTSGSSGAVQRNTARSNSGFGLNLATDSTYRENTITANAVGTVSGTGVNKGGNHCSGTGTVSADCP